MDLTNQQWARYARHISMPEVGIDGQKRLLAARVLFIGAGGLGSPALLYLAAAGVGTIGIADPDLVDESNLQRQVVHSTASLNQPKTSSARERMLGINPDCNIICYPDRLTSQNILPILDRYDILIDGSDNFATRYLTNHACAIKKIPNIFGSVQGFNGQASVFWPGGPTGGPCYQCIFPEPPPPGEIPSCAEAGVLGVLPGMIGMLQATEAVKIILGLGEPLAGRLLLYDALAMSFRTIKLRRNPECPVCGEGTTHQQLIDYEKFCGTRACEFTPEAPTKPGDRILNQITVTELKQRLDSGEKPVILDVRNPDEHEKGAIPGAELVPLQELPKRLADLGHLKDKEVLVHCQKGGRSARACGLLKTFGFENPVNVAGGYEAWQDINK